MGVTSSLPGMTHGHTSRNVLLGTAYVAVLSVAVLSLGPLAIAYESRNGC